jgi:two-component system, OmpR family, response regulator
MRMGVRGGVAQSGGASSPGAAQAEARLLVVEDDPNIRELLSASLRFAGFAVDAVTTGVEAVTAARDLRPDLIVLDVMLPDRSGFEVCRDLRRRGIDTPVLMLTARGEVDDRVLGLRLGADDYLVKPFAMSELLARVEARLRRETAPPREPPEGYRFGEVEVDFRRAEVSRAGQPVALSAKEFQLLCYLIRQRGATLSRDQLLNEVWGYDAMPSTRTVDVHVAWLRRKLEPNPRHPQYILTVHGLGYKFAG